MMGGERGWEQQGMVSNQLGSISKKKNRKSLKLFDSEGTENGG